MSRRMTPLGPNGRQGWKDREEGRYNPGGSISARADYLDGWFAANHCIVHRLGRFADKPAPKTITDYIPKELQQ